MGLKVHSLGVLPANSERDYYVYLLDYGWDEPLGRALFENFNKMADLASKDNAIVIAGTHGSEFNDEVLSWHRVNGQNADELLPAVLITTRHPSLFRERWEKRREDNSHQHWEPWEKDGLLLIPLRTCCNNATEVAELIAGIFHNMREKKALPDFRISQELSAGRNHALVDAIILEPNFAGIGIDLKKIAAFFNQVGQKWTSKSDPN